MAGLTERLESVQGPRVVLYSVLVVDVDGQALAGFCLAERVEMELLGSKHTPAFSRIHALAGPVDGAVVDGGMGCASAPV